MSKTETNVNVSTGEITNVTTADLVAASAWGHVQLAKTAAEKYEAGRYVMELMDTPATKLPVPRFMLDLPWQTNDEETVAEILANLAVSDDIEAATAEQKLRKVDDIVGQAVTIHDVRVRPSDVQDATWGAYLSLAVEVDGGPVEVINGGQGQVAVILWRCWCEGRFPVSGTFDYVGQGKPGRNRPVTFRVESKLG